MISWCKMCRRKNDEISLVLSRCRLSSILSRHSRPTWKFQHANSRFNFPRSILSDPNGPFSYLEMQTGRKTHKGRWFSCTVLPCVWVNGRIFLLFNIFVRKNIPSSRMLTSDGRKTITRRGGVISTLRVEYYFPRFGLLFLVRPKSSCFDRRNHFAVLISSKDRNDFRNLILIFINKNRNKRNILFILSLADNFDE